MSNACFGQFGPPGLVLGIVYGSFPKLGVPFWGPNNKDYSILGSILGSPYFGKLPYNRRPGMTRSLVVRA